MYYKLGQACVTIWGGIVLLQIRANVVTNWGKCCWAKCITNWGRYYKLGHKMFQGVTLDKVIFESK